ncbi:hypothetical protein GN958_ATG13886 [Phytophthora infestans]|uniref:Uncharacterized protein n=1 Tax=Phytophthora infestans TaxID=4787 RepID=A0A8S9U7Q0_PHYIN|nr:hypothetical protein GN958_ATG13886 [Phytophthora infestans]
MPPSNGSDRRNRASRREVHATSNRKKRRTSTELAQGSTSPDSLSSRRTSRESSRSDDSSLSSPVREEENYNRPAAPTSEDNRGLLPASIRDEDDSNLPAASAEEEVHNAPAALARAEVNRSSPPASPSGLSSPVQSNPLPASRTSIGHAALSPASNLTEDVEDIQSAKRCRLLVRPIIKKTVSQRDKSGKRLGDFVANGDTFDENIEKLWSEISEHVKGLARGKHLVDSTKNELDWNDWLRKSRKKITILQIFEYGPALSTAKDRDAFLAACILPEQTDRAGATAEGSLRDVAAQLEEHWRFSLSTTTIGWRLWANYITRNLNRSTWQEQIADPPPATSSISSMLQDHKFRIELKVLRSLAKWR